MPRAGVDRPSAQPNRRNHMTRRKFTVQDASANGQQPAPRSRKSSRSAEKEKSLLREAVETPGSAEPPAGEIRERPELSQDVLPEIAERTLENDDPGEQTSLPPELLTVKISKPTPHIFLQLHANRIFRTALLAYRPSRDNAAEYYHVV